MSDRTFALALGLITLLLWLAMAAWVVRVQGRAWRAPDAWTICTGQINGQPLAQAPDRVLCGTWSGDADDTLVRRVRR